MSAARTSDSALEDLPKPSHKAVEAIRRATEGVNRLLSDLLDVASIEAGRFALDRRAVSSSVVLGDCFNMMQELAEEKRVRLTAELPVVDASVICDRKRAAQAFANFVVNAIEFTPAGGSITLRVEEGPNDVCFSVADTGPRIAQDNLTKVFSSFWQAEKTGHLRTSLGLMLAKGIADAHGGRVWAESQGDHGRTFFLRLPRACR